MLQTAGKLALVWLHDSTSDASVQFGEFVIGRPQFAHFCDENLLVGAFDVTGLSEHLLFTKFGLRELPFMLLLGNIGGGGALEVCSMLQPPMADGEDVVMDNGMDLDGVMASLWSGMDAAGPLLEMSALRREEDEGEQLRREQDEAYRAGEEEHRQLLAERERAASAAAEEEAHEAELAAQAQARRERWLAHVAAARGRVPSHAPQGHAVAGIGGAAVVPSSAPGKPPSDGQTRIRLVLRGGRRVDNNFDLTAPLARLYDWADIELEHDAGNAVPPPYVLVTAYPRGTVEARGAGGRGRTIGEAGLGGNPQLLLEERAAADDGDDDWWQ